MYPTLLLTTMYILMPYSLPHLVFFIVYASFLWFSSTSLLQSLLSICSLSARVIIVFPAFVDFCLSSRRSESTETWSSTYSSGQPNSVHPKLITASSQPSFFSQHWLYVVVILRLDFFLRPASRQLLELPSASSRTSQ